MKLKSLNNRILLAYLSAFLCAILFAVCIPFAKLLNQHIPSLLMGALLYFGAGVGLLITFIVKRTRTDLIPAKKDLPYICAMVIFDISAITLLMYGILKTTGANASLLGNFELVATSLIAYGFFGEKISKNFFIAIILITVASIILSFEKQGAFIFNSGSLLVLLSCICWGFENNCTCKLSLKDTRAITLIKGIFSGLFGLLCSFFMSVDFPRLKWVLAVLVLGFISYGLSVCLYIYAQRFLGAVKTAAVYSTAPFFGVIFSLVLLREKPLIQFYIALFIMFIAVILAVRDAHNS